MLVKRLKQHLRLQVIAEDPSAPQELGRQLQRNPLGLDYLLILDFEATCQEVNPPEFIHEIIEFPVLMLNIKTLKIVSVCLWFAFVLHLLVSLMYYKPVLYYCWNN